MKKGKVIVVSGVTASGKTTLVRELSRLADGIVISFDDYSIDALPSAPSFVLFFQHSCAAINQYDIKSATERSEESDATLPNHFSWTFPSDMSTKICVS